MLVAIGLRMRRSAEYSQIYLPLNLFTNGDQNIPFPTDEYVVENPAQQTLHPRQGPCSCMGNPKQ